MINIIEFLNQNSLQFKGPNKRGYVVLESCVFCEKKGKLNILVEPDPAKSELEVGFTQCYSCRTGGFILFYSKVKKISFKAAKEFLTGVKSGDEEEEVKIEFVKYELTTSLKMSLDDILSKYPKISLPLLSVPIDVNVESGAMEYLLKRGLTPEAIQLSNIHVMPFSNKDDLYHALVDQKLDLNQEDWLKLFQYLGRFLGRVIFPVTVNNDTYGYVARDYWNRDEKYKVLNSEGALSSVFVWNFDLAKKSEVLVVNEGIFDAQNCDITQSLALLGKATSSTSDRVKLLRKLNPKTWVIYLDNGAYKEAMMLAKILSESHDDVRIVFVRPFLNKNLPDDLFKLVSKMVTVETEEDRHVILPRELKAVKDFSKILTKVKEGEGQVIPMIHDRIKLHEYRDEPELKALLVNWGQRFEKLTPAQKTNFHDTLAPIKKFGHRDAGDRSLAENKELINGAIPYSPLLNLDLIG